MKKLFAFVLSAFLFLGMTESLQAKSVTFTEAKKDHLMKTVSSYTSMHYSSYVTLSNPGGGVTKGKSYASLDTASGLLKMTSYLDRKSKKPDGEYVYDYKGKKLHVKKSMGAMMDQANEAALQKVIPFEKTTLKEVFESLFTKNGIKTGIKGKASGNREVYKIKLKELEGIPAQYIDKASLKLVLKKVGAKYFPYRVETKVTTAIGDVKSSASNLVEYLKFDNKKVSLPK